MTAAAQTTQFGEVITLGTNRVRIGGHLEILHVDGALRPIRLPVRFRAQFPPNSAGLRAMTTRPSGVRLSMQTSATHIRLKVRCTKFDLEGIQAEENSFIACIDGSEAAAVGTPVNAVETVSFRGEDLGTQVLQDSSIVDFRGLGGSDKTIDIWLPQMMTVDLIDIVGDAPIAPAEPTNQPVWIHHGSSISHCAEAQKPTSAWPVVAAQIAGLEVINLGFAGQCMLDPFVADAIAATPADLITIKAGINIIGARAMDQRTFVPAVHGFIGRIRRGHPDIPIVIVSSILWPENEDTAGPVEAEPTPSGGFRLKNAGTEADVEAGALSMTIARAHLKHVVDVRRQEGEAIYYLDGHLLYGPDDLDSYPLPDGLHPDARLYEEMGRRFAKLIFSREGLVPQHPNTGPNRQHSQVTSNAGIRGQK